MSLDLAHVIESAADEVASVGRAAAGSLNELVHDWGHETRSFVTEHAPSLPTRSSRRRGPDLSGLRVLVPVLVLGVVAYVLLRRKRRHATAHLPEREHPQDHLHETVVTSSPTDERMAKAAAAS